MCGNNGRHDCGIPELKKKNHYVYTHTSLLKPNSSAAVTHNV